MSEPASDRARSCVLVADEDAGVRQLVFALLSRHAAVALAKDGAEALAILSHGSDFAAVLSDYDMPGASGLEVLRRVGQTRPQAKLILMSGSLSDGIRREAEALGAHVVEKPFGPGIVSRLAALCGCATSPVA